MAVLRRCDPRAPLNCPVISLAFNDTFFLCQFVFSMLLLGQADIDFLVACNSVAAPELLWAVVMTIAELDDKFL